MEYEVKADNSSECNNHTCLENSEWLTENVKGVEKSVKELLLSFEQDSDLSQENLAGNNLKQPDLIAHVKEISYRHHLLAQRYSKLIRELPETEGKNYKGFQLSPSLLTPVRKHIMPKFEGQVVDSDLSLSENSLLSSDSDSESFNSSPNEVLSSVPSGKSKIVNMESELSENEILLRQISKCEQELKFCNKKLRSSEDEIAKLKSDLQKNGELIVNMSVLEAQLVSAKNQVKINEDRIETENLKSLALQRKVTELEGELESEKRQVLELQEKVKKYTTDLSERDVEIQKLSAELKDALSSISNLSESVTFNEAKTKDLEIQCESLLDEIKKYEAGKIEMEKLQEVQKNENEFIQADLRKKSALLDTLEKNLDGLKLKYDMLVVQKDWVDSMLQTLGTDLSFRDDQIQQLEYNLDQLNSENRRLCADSETAVKVEYEMKSRIEELEKEVEMQKMLISDGAEEKREAIRQLCFSLDHYRTSHKELRKSLIMRIRPVARVS